MRGLGRFVICVAGAVAIIGISMNLRDVVKYLKLKAM